MKTIIKKGENEYLDVNSEQQISDVQILDLIKDDEEFEIVDENNNKITDQELAQILRRKTKKKSESEKFFESVKGLFESGKSTATQTFQDLMYAGYGAVISTEEKTRKWIDQLIDSGKISKEKGEEMFKKAKENFQEREKQYEKKAKEVFQNKMNDLGIASAKDLEDKIQTAVSSATSKVEEEMVNLKDQIEELTKGKKK
jgi:polyhydroxyalkanoate synthesis regulator phasin